MLKEYKADQIRNVAIIGHGGTGKSTLLDAMLLAGGKIDKVGNPNQGTLTSDYDEDEKKRMMSIRSAMGFVEIDGVKINIIDTPGTADFIGEARAAVQGRRGGHPGHRLRRRRPDRDREVVALPEREQCPRGSSSSTRWTRSARASRKPWDSVKTGLKATVAPLCVPVGEGEKISGVIDLFQMKLQAPKGGGKDVTVADVPADMKAKADADRNKLVEVAAEGDDALIEKFLEGEALTDDEIRKGLQTQLANAKLHPVVCGVALSCIGVRHLLNVIKDFAPAPAMGKDYKCDNPDDHSKEIVIQSGEAGPLAAVVWKTYIDQYAGRFNYLKVIFRRHAARHRGAEPREEIQGADLQDLHHDRQQAGGDAEAECRRHRRRREAGQDVHLRQPSAIPRSPCS